MTLSPTPYTFGYLGGTPLQGDIGNAAFSNPAMTVELTAVYEMVDSGSVLTRPFQTGADPGSTQKLPQTFQIGTVLRLHHPEATALIAANAATLVSIG
jgi:hypothetical protein